MKDNPLTNQALRKLLRTSVADKKVTFAIDQWQTEYDLLNSPEVLTKTIGKTFQLDFAMLPAAHALLDFALELMHVAMPKTFIEALAFVHDFEHYIRQPKIRHHWEQGMGMRLEAMLWLHLEETEGVDVWDARKALLEKSDEEHRGIRSTAVTFFYSFPFLSQRPERALQIIRAAFLDDRTSDSAWEAVVQTALLKPDKAEQIAGLLKAEGQQTDLPIRTALIIGAYPNDPFRYLTEAFALHKESPVEGLRALASLKYSDNTSIRQAIDFVHTQNISTIEYLRTLPVFYSRIIENPAGDDEITQVAFLGLRELTRFKDPSLRSNLLFRTRMIKGHDKEKMDLLPYFLQWEGQGIMNEYFNYFSSVQPLFHLLRDTIAEYGLTINMELFYTPMQSMATLKKEEFGQELLKLLSDKNGMVRFAGVQILCRNRGERKLSDTLLSLTEDEQLTIIDTLVHLPLSIEVIIPALLTFRHSKFDTAKEALKTGLLVLTEAFESSIKDLVFSRLEDSAFDADLRASFQQTIDRQEIAHQQKSTCKEFDPYLNELEFVEYFFQLEHEKNSEEMEQIEAKSIFADIGQRVSVVRGSAFKIGKSGRIGEMGKFGFTPLVDHRYNINPDKYEQDFHDYINGTPQEPSI
ncbi:hypothetical protein [Longitalea luteola]|uniref:hypothetical protein n=1 Tax=Longitalea luteola TaxID=2812563 RepID=UPI001A95E123|nr:hypothetical protein [Longitalea luteola]